MKFNGVEITEESIQACRQWFIENQQACIDGALDGSLGLASHVNITEYIEACQAFALYHFTMVAFLIHWKRLVLTFQKMTMGSMI